MSAATITKRHNELRVGDVVDFAARGKCSLLCFVSTIFPSSPVSARFASHVTGDVFDVEIDPNATYGVEAPALSPAQQHAEEMLAYLRDVAVNPPVPQIAKRDAELLLAKIDPPAPPTLEEALELLGEALDATRIGFEPLDRRISQFRDRARRTGVLKP